MGIGREDNSTKVETNNSAWPYLWNILIQCTLFIFFLYLLTFVFYYKNTLLSIRFIFLSVKNVRVSHLLLKTLDVDNRIKAKLRVQRWHGIPSFRYHLVLKLADSPHYREVISWKKYSTVGIYLIMDLEQMHPQFGLHKLWVTLSS